MSIKISVSCYSLIGFDIRQQLEWLLTSDGVILHVNDIEMFTMREFQKYLRDLAAFAGSVALVG